MSSIHILKTAPILVSNDIASALARYKALGFETSAYPDTPRSTPIYGYLRSGTFEVHIALFPELKPEENSSACFLWVPDADEVFDLWNAARVQGHLSHPKDTPYGLREFSYIDPDGNLFRIGSNLSKSEG